MIYNSCGIDDIHAFGVIKFRSRRLTDEVFFETNKLLIHRKRSPFSHRRRLFGIQVNLP